MDATVYKTLSNDFDSVIEAVSTGRPLVAYSNSRYSDELKELAAMLAGLPKGDGARRRPLLQSLAAPFKAALNGRAHRDDEVLQDA